MRFVVLPLVLFGWLAAPAVAQEKFNLKIKKDTQGDRTQTTEKDTEKGEMSFSVMGMSQKKDEDKSSVAIYQEVILEKEPGKRPTKIKRIYEKVEGTQHNKKFTPSYVGKELLIERTGTVYKFTVDGKELAGEDLLLLHDEFKDKKTDDDKNIERFLLPKQPVAVNETWKPDIDEIAKDFAKNTAIELDVAKTSASGKLLKAYKKDGKQYGVVEIDLTMAMTKIGAGANAVALNPGSTTKMTVRFDGCIDGTAHSGTMEMTMEMKMTGIFKDPDGKEVKIDATMKKTGHKTSQDLGGKK